MGKIVIVIGIVSALLLVAHPSNGIKCYSCGPQLSGTNCYEAVFNETNEVNCSATVTKCFKAIATPSNGTNGLMVRGCDPSSKCNSSGINITGYTVDCYNCDTDLCNSSEWNSANLITMCLTIFVACITLLK